jgi:hypothetical protein
MTSMPQITDIDRNLQTPSGLYFRTETKFLLTHDRQGTLLNWLRDHFKGDIHGCPADGSYIVTSLYFDDRCWTAYRQKIDGEYYKQKIRLRSYSHSLEASDVLASFIERKMRIQQFYHKNRSRITNAESLDIAVNGLTSQSRRQLGIPELPELMARILVRYRRWAFEDSVMGLRINIDSELEFAVHPSKNFGPLKWTRFDSPSVVELKCIGGMRFPHLELKMAEHGARNAKFSKYAHAIQNSKIYPW